MPPRHPSNAEIPADGHTPESCPLAAEQQAEKGRREVVAWILGILATVAIGVGGWAHLRLWTDNDRLTKLETQREVEKQALEQRLNTLENNLSRQIGELRDLVRSKP
jgi:uncharacterized protein HemX